MQMSHPLLPEQGLQLSEPRQAAEHARGRLARRKGAILVAPVIAYARNHAAQLIRFMLIGAGVAALNLCLLYCFRTLLHFPDPIAVAATYIIGTLIHFPAHRWITYGAQDGPLRPQGLRYAVMLVCNFLILQALVAVGSRMSVSPYVAFMASTGCTMAFNFLVMTHIVFAKERRP
jgi:putative flippase GtrA